MVLKSSLSRPDGVRLQGLLHGQDLISILAILRITLLILSRHGAIHGLDENVTIWENYLKDVGCSNEGLRDGPIVSNADLALRAAISGMGLALMRTSYAASYLATKVLVKLPLPDRPAEFDNVVVCKRTSYRNKSLRHFIDWIKAETERPE